MASLAAVVNPVKRQDGREEVLLFYCTDKQTLGMERHVIGDTTRVFEDHLAPWIKGPITQPGHFAALVYEETVAVYGLTGFTEPEGKGDDKKQVAIVSQLSPFVNPIGDYKTQNIRPISYKGAYGHYAALAAVGSASQAGFIYYLRDQNPESAGKSLLQERGFQLGISSGTNNLTFCNPRGSSRLAACYAGTDKSSPRLVFYQNTNEKDHRIWVANIGNNSEAPILETNGARDGTPLAAVFLSGDNNNQGWVYLYFVDNSDYLNRIRLCLPNWNWDSATMVQPFKQLASSSGLAVVRGQTDTNHVFFTALDGQGFTHVPDQIQ